MEIDARLEKISPLWYGKIIRGRTLKGLLRKTRVRVGLVMRELDLTVYASCMVGESYLFDRSYTNSLNATGNYCKKCLAFSDEVVVAPRNPPTMVISDFQDVIKNFCDHVEKDHGVSLK